MLDIKPRTRNYTVAIEATDFILAQAHEYHYVRGNHSRVGITRYVHDLGLIALDSWTDTRPARIRTACVWRTDQPLTWFPLTLTQHDILNLAILAHRFTVDTHRVQARAWTRAALGIPKARGRPRRDPTPAYLRSLVGPVLTAIGLGYLTPAQWPTEPTQPYLTASHAARHYRWLHSVAGWDYTESQPTGY